MRPSQTSRKEDVQEYDLLQVEVEAVVILETCCKSACDTKARSVGDQCECVGSGRCQAPVDVRTKLERGFSISADTLGAAVRSVYSARKSRFMPVQGGHPVDMTGGRRVKVGLRARGRSTMSIPFESEMTLLNRPSRYGYGVILCKTRRRDSREQFANSATRAWQP